MGRKFGFLLVAGIFLGALTGLAAAEVHFAATGGVADYWPEDNPGAMTQERGPVETGALPAMSEGSGNDVRTVESGGSVYRVDIDAGP